MPRRRSLKKDKNDWNQYRFGRDRHMGVCVSTEFYQPVPMFFTREGANVPLIGHYRGGILFLICNGPSLVSGDYDLSLLKKPGVMTFGINNGPKTIRPDFWTCVDDPSRFLKSIWLDPRITKFVPHAHAEKRIFDNEKWEGINALVGQCPNMYYYHRNEKFMPDRFLFEDTINWGNSGDNGGGRSVMLPALRIAFLMGFRTIYLLGADFKMSEDYTYHFDEQRQKGAVNCNMNTYKRLKEEYFPGIRPYLEAEGCNVYNCNPDSELKAFDYVPYEEAIHHATAHLGDIENERSWGMYSKPDEKDKWKDEPDASQKSHLAYLKNSPNAPVYDANQEVAFDRELKPIPKPPKPKEKQQKPQGAPSVFANIAAPPEAPEAPEPTVNEAHQINHPPAKPEKLEPTFKPIRVPQDIKPPPNEIKPDILKSNETADSRKIIRSLPIGVS